MARERLSLGAASTPPERLIGLVLRPDQGCRAEDREVKPALAAILANEKQALTSVHLEKKVTDLPDGPPSAYEIASPELTKLRPASSLRILQIRAMGRPGSSSTG